MDALEEKINSDDPILVTRVLSEIFEKVRSSDDVNPAMITFMLQKCCCDNPLVSGICCQVVMRLIEAGKIRMEPFLADLVAASSRKYSTGLIKILSSLFYYRVTKLDTTVAMQINQNVFVKILMEWPESQMCIYNEIAQTYKRDEKFKSLITTMYEPVYLFCICNTIHSLNLGLIRESLWMFLLGMDPQVLLKLICWIQVRNNNCIELTSHLLNKTFQYPHDLNNQILILIEVSVLYNSMLNRKDCHSTLDVLKHVSSDIDSPIANISLLLLSQTISISSPEYLQDLFKLCRMIILNNNIHPVTYLTVKYSALVWLGNPCALYKDALLIAQDLLSIDFKHNKNADIHSTESLSGFDFLMQTNFDIALATSITSKLEPISVDDLSVWVEQLQTVPVFLLKRLFSLVCSLCLYKKLPPSTQTKLLSLIVKCTRQYAHLSSHALTIILYQLSDIDYVNIHFELLKALPAMAHNKNNSPKVVATLQAIAQRPQLVCVAASLMYEVWQIDRKYYHNLESLLVMKKPVLLNDLWQYNVTKANIFKKLCESCPELYGKDLVAQLSKLLNECNSKHDELPCALAIEGIAALCRSDVINVATTWTTLSKKFMEDDRRRVIKSLCLLISEVPQLQYSEDNEALNADVLSQLWHYASTNNDSEVVKSAFQVISLFSFENVCEHIPEMYLDENPELYVGGQRLVPGKTWLTFLLKCGHPTEASDFVTRLISKEVANYLKYVYQVKGHREPENYAALPSHSIVRALGEFLKRNFKNYKTWQTDNPDKARLYVECLKILSQKYPKPLPPLDWCFLQELVHESDMRGHCLDLASHQVVLSGSARRLMENIIIAFAEKPQDAEITIVFRNLHCLANSIQPGTLKPFLQASFGYALSVYDEKPALFRSVLLDANDMLKNKNVQDINKNCLGEVLVGLISATDAKSEAFPHMLECLPHISSDTQQSIAKLTGGLFVHREFLKTVKIRCRLVSASVSSNPLNWLNDVIDAAAKNNVGDVIFADIVDAVKTQVHNPASPSWLPELLGQIQVKVTDGVPQREISYWCEVLILATVTFSGFYAFLNENYENAGELFPAALSVLMTETGWDALKTQVLEWLHHMHFESSVAKRYRLVLGRALCALRHEEEFSKNSRWMKYLDCKILASEIN